MALLHLGFPFCLHSALARQTPAIQTFLVSKYPQFCAALGVLGQAQPLPRSSSPSRYLALSCHPKGPSGSPFKVAAPGTSLRQHLELCTAEFSAQLLELCTVLCTALRTLASSTFICVFVCFPLCLPHWNVSHNYRGFSMNKMFCLLGKQKTK